MGKQIKDRFILILEATIDILGLVLLVASVIKNNKNKRK